MSRPPPLFYVDVINVWSITVMTIVNIDATINSTVSILLIKPNLIFY